MDPPRRAPEASYRHERRNGRSPPPGQDTRSRAEGRDVFVVGWVPPHSTRVEPLSTLRSRHGGG